MTEQEIIEGNKLIAEFMELNYQDYNIDWRVLMPVVEKIKELEFKNKEGEKLPMRIIIEFDSDKSSKWHYSGNHCAIESYGVGHRLVPQISHNNPNVLEATWTTIVEFIKWYNSQTQKP